MEALLFARALGRGAKRGACCGARRLHPPRASSWADPGHWGPTTRRAHRVRRRHTRDGGARRASRLPRCSLHPACNKHGPAHGGSRCRASHAAEINLVRAEAQKRPVLASHRLRKRCRTSRDAWGRPASRSSPPAPAIPPVSRRSARASHHARAGFHSRTGPPAYIPIPVSTMPHRTPTTYSATRMTTFSRRLRLVRKSTRKPAPAPTRVPASIAPNESTPSR